MNRALEIIRRKVDHLYTFSQPGLIKREAFLAFFLILPTVFIVLAVSLGPLLFAGWLSLHDVGANIFGEKPFVGLQNYVDVFQSRSFQDAAINTSHFVIVSLLIQLPIGMAIALLLNEQFYGRNIVRAIILIPWAIPTVVNGALWQWIYNSSYGALNGILIQFNIIEQPIIWLGSSSRAMNLVIIADTWKVLPFYSLLFLAGLQIIPSELYDALEVDGGNAWDKLVHIILPFIRPFILIVLVLRTMEAFRVFDIVYMLTKGGPAGSTTVLSYYTYLATFHSLEFGIGSAMSFTIGGIILIMAVLYYRLLKSDNIR
jgi:ABC-type sugar transport system permease subunit